MSRPRSRRLLCIIARDSRSSIGALRPALHQRVGRVGLVDHLLRGLAAGDRQQFGIEYPDLHQHRPPIPTVLPYTALVRAALDAHRFINEADGLVPFAILDPKLLPVA